MPATSQLQVYSIIVVSACLVLGAQVKLHQMMGLLWIQRNEGGCNHNLF